MWLTGRALAGRFCFCLRCGDMSYPLHHDTTPWAKYPAKPEETTGCRS